MGKIKGTHMEYLVYDLSKNEICLGCFEYETTCKVVKVSTNSLRTRLTKGFNVFNKRYKVVRCIINNETDEIEWIEEV